MTDLEAATLCAMREAANQPDEGVAAIVQVILFRTALRYASPGTIQGTIDEHAQFSWTEFAFVNGRYQQVAVGLAAELSRVQALLEQSEAQSAEWARCERIAAAVLAGTFHGPLFDQLTPETVLYYNPSLVAPYWAATSRKIVDIGQHRFMAPNGLHSSGQSIAANDLSPIDPIAATKAAIGEA
jgi:spore germination cell wall hydrolase CwlJ-like protein